ncbi:hypothetical protein RRG08_045228 [Elysia crispata]|uniref:Uncharacterized protein n=1 Tax=Elysia crispata TaxID=231223 RepID=A0AAE1A212_9GAST|nr:hypothetical protein RRG08_045228 [Elysia crispata]
MRGLPTGQHFHSQELRLDFYWKANPGVSHCMDADPASRAKLDTRSGEDNRAESFPLTRRSHEWPLELLPQYHDNHTSHAIT